MSNLRWSSSPMPDRETTLVSLIKEGFDKISTRLWKSYYLIVFLQYCVTVWCWKHECSKNGSLNRNCLDKTHQWSAFITSVHLSESESGDRHHYWPFNNSLDTAAVTTVSPWATSGKNIPSSSVTSKLSPPSIPFTRRPLLFKLY